MAGDRSTQVGVTSIIIRSKDRPLIFRETSLPGAYIIDPERIEDDRGFFARGWCEREFAAKELNTRLSQCNISFNHRRGTTRGMHFQRAPHAEVKLVRCTMGSVYDAIVDVRPDSPTYGRWLGVELSAENRRMLYIPEGFAHGYQTLEDNSEVFYQVSMDHHPESADGFRWNDPQFRIDWPLTEQLTLSSRDATWPDFANRSSR
jgi:dTDP-4-dehydrorhamnose 3,5-epimerase